MGEEKTLNTKPTVAEFEVSKLLKELKQQALQLLMRYSYIWDGNFGEVEATERAIDLETSTKPVRKSPYRAGHRDRASLFQEVRKVLTEWVIQPSKPQM